MNHLFKSAATVAIFTALLFSCTKEEYITQTIDQTITAGQEYSIALPLTDDPYTIISDAKNATSSYISKDANGNPIYVYTSNAGFIGTEAIVVSTSHPEKGAMGEHPHPKHDHMDRPLDSNKVCGNKPLDSNRVCGPKPHTEPAHKGKGKHKGKGNCDKSATEDDYIVNINLTVVADPSLN